MASRGTSPTSALGPSDHWGESLAEWINRQHNPSKPDVENNAEIDAVNKEIHDRFHGRSAPSPDATTAPPSQLSSGHHPNDSRLTNDAV